MKVLQINSVCGRGSTGRIATDLADILSEQGHECRIAYGRGTVPEKYQNIAVRIGTDWDVRFHGIKTRLFDRHGFGSRAATEKFLKWVQKYDPDVIHLHNIHGYYINIELLFEYLKKARKPVIWTLHDCWAFTGHCTHYTIAQCEQWKTRCANCTQTGKYPKSAGKSNCTANFEQKKRLFTGVHNLQIITPSNWLADQVRQSFLKEYGIKVIPNGIDLEAFQPTKSDFCKKYGLTDKKIVLGVANVWGPSKGLPDFTELSEYLDEHHKIVLVGLTKEQIRNLPDGILGLARTNNVKELAEVYSAADVFVNPSREETMGLVTVEAMACGTPVIVYDQTAVPEVVDPGCGFVVKAGDLKSAADIIIREDYAALSPDCIKKAKMYDKKLNFMKYIDCYKG